MELSVNTYVLKGFDKEQTDFLCQSLQYISSKLNFENKTKVIDKLNISLKPNDYVLIYIDELSLSQFNETANRSFFEKKEYRNNQIVLILDEVRIQQLPDYCHYFQAYPLLSTINFSDDESEEWESKDKDTHKTIEVLYDIAQFIKNTKSIKENSDSLVFLGPYDDNTTFEFHKIIRELIHRNCNIAPNILNPSAKELLDNSEYFNNVLSGIELSIHFIGYNSISNYPESETSALKINRLLAEYCKTPEGENVQRIIYIPAESDDTPEHIKQKIALFKSNLDNIINGELVQTPIEKFKELVVNKLNELSTPLEGKSISNDKIDDIYFIYPPDNNEGVDQLENWFNSKKLSYSLSQVDLDHLDLLNYHQNKLKTCRGVVIFNNGNTNWLMRKLSDLKKAPGWGRKTPFEFKVIVHSNTIADDNGRKVNNKLTIDQIDFNKDFTDLEKIILA